MIRNVKKEDTRAILDIYSPYILNTAVTFEYDIPSFDEFEKRIEDISKDYPYLVYEENGIILGYAYAHRFSERKAFDYSVELSVYVCQNARGRGIGKSLYLELIDRLKKQNIASAYTLVAATSDKNDEHLTSDSLSFHIAMGFKEAGRLHRCGYKFNKWYDLVYYELSLV